MNNKYYYFLFLLFLIPIVVASEYGYDSNNVNNIGVVKQDSCITLPQTCNCTFSNITVIVYPDKTSLTLNTGMTKDGTYFNYTFCNTNELGQYFVNGVGDKDGNVIPFTYFFTVTPTGISSNIGFFIFITIVVLGMLLLGILVHNLELTLIGALISAAWGIYTAFYGFDVIKNVGTEVMSIGILAFSLYWIAIAGIDYLGE
jgi:hypothetical protein